jgi:hypothetical protein
VHGRDVIVRADALGAPRPGDPAGLDYADSDLFTFDADGRAL